MTELFKVINIETRNTCTKTCWFCKFGLERQDETLREMDWSLIERIVYNLKDLDYRGRISWYGINEPLLDKRMLEILKFTKRHCPHAFLSFISNGDLLDAGIYKNLRQSGLDALGVSIYNDRTFEKINRIKDDRLVILEMRDLPPGRLENRAGSIKAQRTYQFEDELRQFENSSCARPFSMMVVNPTGQIVLCASDMYGDVIMGDVQEQRLEEIWNNEQFRHYRRTLMEQGRKDLKLCQDCSYGGKGPNVFLPLETKPEVERGEQKRMYSASSIQSGNAARG
jgi:radical SAM protein with 4Fe4S-binding SPASM domain